MEVLCYTHTGHRGKYIALLDAPPYALRTNLSSYLAESSSTAAAATAAAAAATADVAVWLLAVTFPRRLGLRLGLGLGLELGLELMRLSCLP